MDNSVVWRIVLGTGAGVVTAMAIVVFYDAYKMRGNGWDAVWDTIWGGLFLGLAIVLWSFVL